LQKSISGTFGTHQ